MTALSFDILGHDRSGSQAFDKVGKAADRTRGKFNDLGNSSHRISGSMVGAIGKIGAALGAVATVAVFKSFIAEARESRKVGAITASVIKSTGGAAKVSAKQVGDLSMAISNKTGIDDEAIQSGSNLLLTFKNVRNETGKGADIFNRATQAAVDLSAVGFGDVNSASKMLGKALNDPLKGLTALGKAGVTFTQSQKDQIATLVASGKTLQAQQVIMTEVESQVGGAASAAADPMQKLGVIIDNVKETIGTALLPAVDAAATWLGDHLPGAVDKATKAVTGLFDLLVKGDFTSAFHEAFNVQEDSPLVTALLNVHDTAARVIPQIVDTFKGLGGKILDAIGTIDLGKIGADLWTSASGWATLIINGVKYGIDTGDWKPLGKALGTGLVTALTKLGDAAKGVGDAIGRLIDKIHWKDIGSKLSKAITDLFTGIPWKDVGSALGDGLSTMVNTSKDLAVKAANAMQTLIQAVDWRDIGRKSTDAVGRFVSGVDWVQVGKSVAVAMGYGIKVNLYDIPNMLVGALADLALGIWDSLNAAMTRGWTKAHDFIWKIGGDLISGLWGGITGALKGAEKWIETNIVTPIHNWVRKLFGANSPSTMFSAIGGDLILGLLKGLLTGAATIGKWLYTNVVQPVVGAFVKAGTWLVQAGKNVIQGFWNGLLFLLNAARGAGGWFYDHVISPVVGAFAKAGTWLVQAGKNVIQGFWNGLLFLLNGARGIGGWFYDHVISPAVAAFAKAGTWLNQAGKNVIQGFWNGLTEIWDKVTAWVGRIATWIKDHKGPVSLDAKLLVPAGKAIMQGFLTGLESGAGKAWTFVTSVGGKAKEAVAEAYGWLKNVGWPAITNAGAVPNATGMAKLVQTVAASRGWGSGYEWDALYKLIQGESGFRSNAQNPTSTAYGLFQFLDSTWGTVGATKTSDPTRQTIAGLNYIQQKYGSPAQAYAAWSSRKPHWYGEGGLIAEKILGVGLRTGRKYGFGERGNEWVVPASRRAVGGTSVSLLVESSGSRMDDLLADLIRRYVRGNGGNVQAVLGRG